MKKYKIDLVDSQSVTIFAESGAVEDGVLLFYNSDGSITFCAAVGKWSHFKEVKEGEAD